MSLGSGEGHNCDGRLIDVAYDRIASGKYGAPVAVEALADYAEVPVASVLAWIESKSDLMLKDESVMLVPSELEPPAEDPGPNITPMFLLSRVEHLAQELGRKDVQIALLEQERPVRVGIDEEEAAHLTSLISQIRKMMGEAFGGGHTQITLDSWKVEKFLSLSERYLSLRGES